MASKFSLFRVNFLLSTKGNRYAKLVLHAEVNMQRSALPLSLSSAAHQTAIRPHLPAILPVFLNMH